MTPKVNRIAVVLLDLRSSENAGAICRTAECAGVKEMYCVGTTPGPLDRFGRINKKFAKASLGAEKNVQVEYCKDIGMLLKKLKKPARQKGCSGGEKFEIIALEQNKRAIDYRKFKPRNNFALIVGNEVDGIPNNILSKADKIIEIPLRGEKESLNVSVAFGVSIFEIVKNIK